MRSKPRYLELAELFTARIGSGEFAVGSLLPTELDICSEFAVSRYTARAALAQLTAAGLVSRRPGAGTKVLTQHALMRFEHEVGSIEDLLQYGSETLLQVISSRRETVDAQLAPHLGTAVGRGVVHIEALRMELPSRVAVAVTRIYLPQWPELALAGLLDRDTAARSLARLLEPSTLSSVEQVFDATTLSIAQAHALGVPRRSAAMRVQRHYRDANGRLLAFATSLHPAGLFAYRTVLAPRRG